MLLLLKQSFLSGTYLYLESSYPLRSGDKVSLISEFISVPKTCLRFYYHMFGDRLGTLNVKLKLRNGKLETLWTKAKNQLDYWRMGHTSIDQDMGYQVCAIHCVKSVRIWSFSGPYFSTFRVNAAEKLRIQTSFTQ